MPGEITITDRATEKIRKLLTGANEGHGLRVNVVEGGCSGYEYKMEIDSAAAEDKVFEKNGVRVLLGGDRKPRTGRAVWPICSTKIRSSLSPLGSTKIRDLGFLSLTSVGKLTVSKDRTR